MRCAAPRALSSAKEQPSAPCFLAANQTGRCFRHPPGNLSAKRSRCKRLSLRPASFNFPHIHCQKQTSGEAIPSAGAASNICALKAWTCAKWLQSHGPLQTPFWHMSTTHSSNKRKALPATSRKSARQDETITPPASHLKTLTAATPRPSRM